MTNVHHLRRLARPVAVVALLAGGSAALAAGRPKAGQWEVTVAVSSGGVQLPPTAQTQCLSQKDVDAEPVPEIERGACRATGIRRTGDTVTWDLACGELGHGKGELTYTSPTSYDGSMSLELSGATVRATIQARRTGDCEAGRAPGE